MYSIRLLSGATRELEDLDKSVAQRLVRRLRWLAENADSVTHEPLKGSLTGLYKLRQGDYRIGYELLKGEEVMLVHFIGHRREIYKRKS
jgi:mRNA interferase RelE/StbE